MTPQDPLRREPYAGWADDGHSRPLPPTQPQGWVDPPRSGLLDDGYLVEPLPSEPTPRRWRIDRERWGCSYSVLALILALSGVPGVVAGEPPTSQVGTAIYSASATWCAPTPDKCTDWGGNARLAAVNSFTWGDEPYWVRITRDNASADALIVSHCACRGEDGYIDVSPAVFEQLAPLSRGRIDVVVEVLIPDQHPEDPPEHPDDARLRIEDGGPVALPATDAAP